MHSSAPRVAVRSGMCRWLVLRAAADLLERCRERQPPVEVGRVPALVGDVTDGTGQPLLEFKAESPRLHHGQMVA